MLTWRVLLGFPAWVVGEREEDMNFMAPLALLTLLVDHPSACQTSISAFESPVNSKLLQSS